jgi:hypothetical protein
VEQDSLSDFDLAALADAANDPRADNFMNAALVKAAERLAGSGYLIADSGAVGAGLVISNKGRAYLEEIEARCGGKS